jgi:hypothetical protein
MISARVSIFGPVVVVMGIAAVVVAGQGES